MPLNNPISNPITLLLLILCVALAIKHVIFLFGRKAEKDIANKILGVLAFIFLLFFLPAVLYRFDILDHFPHLIGGLLYTSPSPRDRQKSRMASSA